MKKTTLGLLKASILASIAATGALQLLSSKSFAQQGILPACPASGSATQAEMQVYLNGCSSTPDQYEVTFFDIGICTSSPITGTSFNPSSCVKLFESPGGRRVNLAGGSALELGKFEKLNAGRYTHLYAVVSNRFLIKGQYEIKNEGTWFTDGRDPDDAPGFNNSTNIAPAIAFENLLSNFAGGDNDPCKTVDGFNLEGGSLDALLVNSSLQVACQGSTKIIASFVPSSPLVISEDDGNPTIDAAFTITNNGLVVYPRNTPGQGVLSFGGGGFFPRFRIIEDINR